MAQIHYNDVVKKIINELSTSTNVLEKYDNVTYNITLYMLDRKKEKIVDENIANNKGFISEHIDDNEKIIIAQSGVTLNFVIDSLLIKTVYGNFNNPINVHAYEMNLKIKEPMGANLTNALDLSALALGYSTHLERPYWIDIYFTGYEHGSMKPIKKIPLDGKLDTLTYRGMFGDVKSSVDNLGTTWNMTFIPYAQKFTNKNINYLRVTSEFKQTEKTNLEKIMNRLTELMKEDYIETFDDDIKEKVRSKLNEKGFINIEYRFNNPNKKASSIIIDPNTSGDDTPNDTINFKINQNEFFTTAVQKILTKTHANSKSLVASFIINPITEEVTKEVEINRYNIIIELYEDPIIKTAVMGSNDFDPARDEYITKCKNDRSLFKKYIFGFSGIDTSVLEIHNVYDLLWYTTSISDSNKKFNKANQNLLNSKIDTNKTKNEDDGINGSKDGGEQAKAVIEAIKQQSSEYNAQLGEIKSYLQKNHYVEDMFYDKYEEFVKKTGNLALEVPERSNKLNISEEKLASQSESKEYDKQAIIADIMFDKLYKSGQLSTTKFTIIADPYWLIPLCVVDTDAGLKISNIMSKEPGSRTYKCAFELRTFYKQVKNYRNEQAGYIDGKQTLGADYAMNPALNVSGIYIIYQAETKFEDGKFIQTLNGVLDPHFLSNF